MNIYNLKYATPDIDARIKRTKRIRNFFIFGIPLGFIMFGGGMPLSMITERLYLLFIPIMGFLFLPTSIISMAVFSTRLNNMNSVSSLLNTIKSQDKTFFFQITGPNPAAELQAATFIRKAIENGLLEGYTVCDGIAVVKTSAGLSEKEIKNEYALLKFGKINDDNDGDGYVSAGSLGDYAAKSYGEKQADSITKECYYCHATLPKDAVYCSKCGARLDY